MNIIEELNNKLISKYFTTKFNQISTTNTMYIFKSRGDGHSLLEQEMTISSSFITPKIPFLKSKCLEWKWYGMIAAIIIIIILICASFPSSKFTPNSHDTRKITTRSSSSFTKSTIKDGLDDYAECSSTCINGQ